MENTKPSSEAQQPKVRLHLFDKGAGLTIVEGKSHYPDILQVEMDRSEAFHVAMRILKRLVWPYRARGGKIFISMSGKLNSEKHDESRT